MAFIRGGWSLLSGRLLRSCPAARQAVVFMSTEQQPLSKSQAIQERERRRKAVFSASVITRLDMKLSDHSLDSMWTEIEDGRGTEVELDDIMLPKLSKHWREQLMNLLSYSRDNIVPQVDNFEVGKSLYEYCLQNFDTLDRFQKLSICANFISHCIIYAPEAEKERLILDTYEKIMKTAVVLDKNISEIVIKGLSHTKEWRQCREIINSIKQLYDLYIVHVSPYIRAALENGDIRTAFDLIDLLDEEGLFPNDEVFTAFIKHNNEELLERFLKMCHKKKWVPSKDSACKLMDWFEHHHSGDWVGSFALSERDRCQLCSGKLEEAKEMSVAEFKALRDSMMKNTFDGDQSFVYSTPEEATSFQSFLSKSRGWDIVVDGLNLGFSFGTSKLANKRSMAFHVQEVIEDLHQRLGKRVCIIAKSHIQQWNPSVFKQIEQVADVFYTRNDSDDDRFLLIAALSSSPETMILSRDFFRQHSHPLQDRWQRELIIRWQRTHQVGIRGERNGRFIYKMPPKHDFCIQATATRWHIPYLDSGSIIYSAGANNSSATNRRQGKASYEAPNHWICLQQKKAKKMDVRASQS